MRLRINTLANGNIHRTAIEAGRILLIQVMVPTQEPDTTAPHILGNQALCISGNGAAIAKHSSFRIAAGRNEVEMIEKN